MVAVNREWPQSLHATSAIMFAAVHTQLYDIRQTDAENISPIFY